MVLQGWQVARGGLDVAVFGSFDPANLPRLDATIGHLRKAGFSLVRRVDADPEATPADVLLECQELARQADRAVFVMFREPAEANQSAIVELTTRLNDHLQAIDPWHGHTILVPQRGVVVRTLLLGFREVADLTITDPWASQNQLNAAALGALVGML